MKKSSKSEEKIIEAARKLFWKYGFKKTTVEEIAVEAGVSKMTFYRKFPNKDEIVFLILTNMMEEGIVDYKELLLSNITFLEKVANIIEMEKAQLNRFSEEFIQDVYHETNSQFAQIISVYQKQIEEITSNFFKASQEGGWIQKDLKIPFILYQMNAINQKASDPELLKLYDTSKELIIDLIKHFFYGIIETKKA